jgi:probable HAF family extracellular repeat protein
VSWVSARSTSVRRVGAALAAAAVAIVPTTAWAPAGASGRDTTGNDVPGFLFSDGRYTAFEPRATSAAIFPSGINDRGDITGEYIRPDGESGFVRDETGRIKTFDVGGARGTEAVKINDRGQIVGRYSEDTPFVDDSARVRGYLRDGDEVTKIDYPDAVDTLPTGINDRGHVVGYYVDARGATHGFVWRNGRFSRLDAPRGTGATPVDINDRGEVVGLRRDGAGEMQGFLLSDGRYTTFSVPGARTTIPFGINDDGQIVGYTADDANRTGARGFLMADGADGAVTPIAFPGAPRSLALGINDQGHIVGVHEAAEEVTPDPNGTADVMPGRGDSDERPPGMLSDLGLTTVQGITVSSAIADQVDRLLTAAEADGVSLTGSGYRDRARQIELRRAHCGTSNYAIYEMPSSSCSPPTARPGMSMHERGLAIDFSCDGSLVRSRSGACFRWLAANAASYGLYNLPSEPWHWSTTGS